MLQNLWRIFKKKKRSLLELRHTFIHEASMFSCQEDEIVCSFYPSAIKDRCGAVIRRGGEDKRGNGSFKSQ